MARKKINQRQRSQGQGTQRQENQEPKKLEDKLHLVITQKWMESERGCGPKPEGYSLHKDYDDHRKYRQEHDECRRSPVTPNEYSFPTGGPNSMLIPQKVYNRVTASENGIWISNSMYSHLKS